MHRVLKAGGRLALHEVVSGPAGGDLRGMSGGVDGVTLALLMPDFDERMAGLARNVEEQRVGLIMAVFSRPWATA
jgi:hypothetical protein